MNNNMNNMNNMNNNMNNNFNNPQSQSMPNINNNNNNNQPPEPQGNIPRKEGVIYDTNTSFPPDAKVKNITFEASTGLKVVINIDSKTTVKDLIKRYINRIGINESLIGNGVLFLMNGRQMIPDSTQSIETFPDMTHITVFDQNNVIGA